MDDLVVSDSDGEISSLFDSDFDDSDSDDEMMMHIAARGRVAKNVRPRVNHFEIWTEDEFFMRFRLTRPTVLHILDQIENELETPTDR